jgi:hypothetical protein
VVVVGRAIVVVVTVGRAAEGPPPPQPAPANARTARRAPTRPHGRADSTLRDSRSVPTDIPLPMATGFLARRCRVSPRCARARGSSKVQSPLLGPPKVPLVPTSARGQDASGRIPPRPLSRRPGARRDRPGGVRVPGSR